MSRFSFTNSTDLQSAIRQALTGTASLPTLDAGAPPPLPAGTRQRHQETKTQAYCRTHARSAPHRSAKRW